MPDLAYYLRRARSLGARDVTKKLLLRRERARELERLRSRDEESSSYSPRRAGASVARVFPAPPAATPGWLAPVTEQFLAHRVDLLGSGWTEVRHGMRCRGVEGHVYEPGPALEADLDGEWLRERVSGPNLDDARHAWRLIAADPRGAAYTPIDWQLDFKSGFRWDEREWYGDIEVMPGRGADVKVPWELSRMQHLPLLAWAHAAARAGTAGFDETATYVSAFRNTVLDFVATNPPRFGVAWAGPMDTAIRLVNVLVAYDLMRAAGAEFDAVFEEVLAASLWDHAHHVSTNLEWAPEIRTNHYLTEVAGLVFAGAYLDGEDADAWLQSGLQELTSEVDLQFMADGSSFEASTAYHRLSAETVVWTTAVALGLDDTPSLPPWYAERLTGMGRFARDLTKPSGAMAQIGDNDSARFLRLSATFTRLDAPDASRRFANLESYESADDGYWLEEHLDAGPLLDAVGALVPDSGLAGEEGEDGLVRALIMGASGGKTLSLSGSTPRADSGDSPLAGDVDAWRESLELSESAADRVTTTVEIPSGAATGARLVAYEDFGVYVARTDRFFASIRCGSAATNEKKGHAHNDQLALELQVEGEDVLRDPGTYLYTPSVDTRNEYRSVRAHFAPRIDGREPASLDVDPFRLDDASDAECLYFGPEGFLGRHSGYGPALWRRVEFLRDRIRIVDWCDDASVRLGRSYDPPAFSPGYGMVLAKRAAGETGD